MAKTTQHEAVKTEVETSAAVETVAEVQQTDTVESVIIPEPEVQAAEVTPEAEVVAEVPKLVDLPIAVPQITQNGTVVEQKLISTPKEERLYRLVLNPAPGQWPKGHQRSTVLNILNELRKQTPPVLEVTAKMMVPRAIQLGLTSTTGVETSIAWHLHQMTLLKPALVVCLNGKQTVEVERKVTPAEATAIPKEDFDKMVAEKVAAAMAAYLATQTTTK